MFLDETAATTIMARRYGRLRRGRRCRVGVPLGQRCTTTVTAALRTTGLLATAMVDGAVNGQRFRDYVTHTLVPALKPGDAVVVDNLPVHKVQGVREAVEAAGALVFLPPPLPFHPLRGWNLGATPPYSPDFNPIEQTFAKLKALLRTAAARTVPDLHQAIRAALARFTPQECRNYVTAAGYEDDQAVAT